MITDAGHQALQDLVARLRAESDDPSAERHANMLALVLTDPDNITTGDPSPPAKPVPIPISAGADVCHRYGYDQVVIIARKTGFGGVEHVTTYGVNKIHCSIAAAMGNFLKHKVMGWPEQKS